jgi:hypothetical protein
MMISWAFFDTENERDNKNYAAGVRDGLQGGWLDDQSQSFVGGVPLPSKKDADVYNKGYEWGKEHRAAHRERERERAYQSPGVNETPPESDAGGSSDYDSSSSGDAEKPGLLGLLVALPLTLIAGFIALCIACPLIPIFLFIIVGNYENDSARKPPRSEPQVQHHAGSSDDARNEDTPANYPKLFDMYRTNQDK